MVVNHLGFVWDLKARARKKKSCFEAIYVFYFGQPRPVNPQPDDSYPDNPKFNVPFFCHRTHFSHLLLQNLRFLTTAVQQFRFSHRQVWPFTFTRPPPSHHPPIPPPPSRHHFTDCPLLHNTRRRPRHRQWLVNLELTASVRHLEVGCSWRGAVT